MSTPVSQRAIATRLGLSQSTVSLALAGNPRIPADTREAVRRVARELAYRPDPALRSLARYRRSVQPAHYHATLAWVHGWPSAEAWRRSAVFDTLFRNASERAQQLGYRVENFWLHPDHVHGPRATRVLVNRGIRGLLLLPYTELDARTALDWDRFCAIRLFCYPDAPALHLLMSDHAQALRRALDETARRGYSRPSLLTSHRLEETLRLAYVAAYEGARAHHGADWPPVFWHEGADEAAFRRWFRRHRPDVLLLSYSIPEYERVFSWLRRLRLRVPEDIGIVMLCLPDRAYHLPPEAPTDLSGIDERFDEMGRRAVDFVVHLLEGFEHGETLLPIRQLMSGRWHEGATLRPSPSLAGPTVAPRS